MDSVSRTLGFSVTGGTKRNVSHFFISSCRNRARMMKAVRALIAAPQNNLKVFKVCYFL